jgi:arabinan endo-1,5-alpha-L-arabinosidase
MQRPASGAAKRREAMSASRGLAFLVCFFWLNAPGALGLDGSINIHDPSTVIRCDGRYYVFGTGRGIPILSSDDGFTWQRSGRVFDRIPQEVLSKVPTNDGSLVWAPDITKANGNYYLYYAVSSWNVYVSAVGVMSNPTLDPKSPHYKWTDAGLVVNSVEGEDLNAIDPGACSGPDGSLWLCYGSYHGKIQVVQLDPKTGGRISPNSATWNIASQSEASDIIYHDGYYYLFVNHGTCCQGIYSTYNIRVGRAVKITGPYLDRHGDDLMNGAGTLFVASAGRQIGPGHFGRLIDDGVEKFSCHFEADLDHRGRSVLAIRPLLWTADGWPKAGENLKDGTYQVVSQQTGTNLQMDRTNTAAELGEYLVHKNQQWEISAAGGGCYKITNAQSHRVLQAGADKSIGMAADSGDEAQLWKIDQLSDGSYRFESKASGLALTTDRDSSVSLENFTRSDTQRWEMEAP